MRDTLKCQKERADKRQVTLQAGTLLYAASGNLGMYDVTHLGLKSDLLNLLDNILCIRVTRQSSINLCIVLSI